MNDIDTVISRRLRAAVDDVHPAPSYAGTVLRGGRARRRRRQGVVAGFAALVVIGSGAALLGNGGFPGADGPGVAEDGGTGPHAAALAWARELPEGPVAELPFFGEGGLRDGDQVVPLPDQVNRSGHPQRVAGGWVVVLGASTARLEPAVLSPEGALRRLPPYSYTGGSMDPTVLVSPDGSRVAYGDRVVDLASGDLTQIPHDPADDPDAHPDYVNVLELVAWEDDGLVYRGSPTRRGWGTTWLLRDDGSTAPLLAADDPRNVTGDGVGDVVLGFDYSRKGDTCSTVSRLEGTAWVAQPARCMDRHLGEALDVSPDGRWLLTDDLPEVWDLEQGQWAAVDVPRSVVEGWGEGWMSMAGWESPDTLLLPVADRWAGWDPVAEPFDQHLQVVRCRMSTGDCERAGEEQVVHVEDEERNPMQHAPGVHFSPY